MKTNPIAKTTIQFTQTFTEGEARALDALVGYGIEPFLKVFYAQMGKAYLQPYEQDLRKLFESIGEIRSALNEVDTHRRLLARALENQA